MTTLETTQGESLETVPVSLADGLAVMASPLVARALPLVVARLADRHPGVPTEIVEHHVQAAAERLISEAWIQDYLPILIERTASVSLEAAATRRNVRTIEPSSSMDDVHLPHDWSTR